MTPLHVKFAWGSKKKPGRYYVHVHIDGNVEEKGDDLTVPQVMSLMNETRTKYANNIVEISPAMLAPQGYRL
jgi:hypothetical protein